jgi:cellulose synthase/poly-beta-1,6-N-acetylglucosamine synthase-like glycosyltransferase
MNVSGGGHGQQRAERREHAAEAVGGRRAMQRNGNPRVSVVVPTRNEARNLEVVLPAVAAVRPAVHEIIIVDGNSVDGTIETAQRVLPWVKIISQTR